MNQNRACSEDKLMDDKKIQLYLKQKELLDTFLKSGAITKEQYNKSLGDLTEKMGMQEYKEIIISLH